MVRFPGKIVQFGFGAVGKSFYEKVAGEIRFEENKYFVITKYADEFEAFIALGGMAANFVACEITRENFREVFGAHLDGGDLLIDLADTVGTRDICDWCAQHNIMYLNTGDADWPEDWLNIFRQHRSIEEIRQAHRDNPATNAHPIVLQHGNNPGLVSHFVKAAIEYVTKTQRRGDRVLKDLVTRGSFNEAARRLGVRMIQVNDIDLQEIDAGGDEQTLFNTWCIDAFFFELLSQATVVLGSHEAPALAQACRLIDPDRGHLELEQLAARTTCRSYCPHGAFEGFLIPHEETVTIARSLEVRQGGELVYRPSVMFVYSPCRQARRYLRGARVNDYPRPDPAGPPDGEENGRTVIRGYVYPEHAAIAYRERIVSGTEYVGVLLIGDRFDPVWVGNRVEPAFLYKKPQTSYWQTPTITPVAMSALAAACWMVRHRDRGGIYLPDDIPDYRFLLKLAEKYISKTIYQTFGREMLQKALAIDLSDIRSRNFFVG